MSAKDEQLPASAEKLLGEWPMAERSDDAWEKSALAIEARLDGDPGDDAADDTPDDDALFAAPLPAELGEDGATPEPPSVSLAELARQSVADAQPESDSDLALDALSVASRARASQPIIPASVRADAARIAAQAAAPAAPNPAVTASAAPAATPSRGPWIASALLLGGLVVAVAIVWRARQPADGIAYMPNKPETPAAAASVAAKAPLPGDPALSIDQLPGEAEKKAAAAGGGKVARAGAGAGKAAKPSPESTKPEEKPKQPEKVAAKPKDEDEKGLQPAASPTNVPQKPSTGAVQAAIGSVLGGARACVAGHKAPSRATLTFGSNGKVKSVAVSGPAGGTAAEGCIRAALSRARVQPFSRPSFSVGVTVRP